MKLGLGEPKALAFFRHSLAQSRAEPVAHGL
jgi:hypothetical protein